jgi:hypothetical protein
MKKNCLWSFGLSLAMVSVCGFQAHAGRITLLFRHKADGAPVDITGKAKASVCLDPVLPGSCTPVTVDVSGTEVTIDGTILAGRSKLSGAVEGTTPSGLKAQGSTARIQVIIDPNEPLTLVVPITVEQPPLRLPRIPNRINVNRVP